MTSSDKSFARAGLSTEPAQFSCSVAPPRRIGNFSSFQAPNRATLWATVFVDELARAGLRAVCIAPGSRSTPLTVAFAAHPQVAVYSHLDERSAAYFALGIALGSGRPAAVVCTSGTAVANLHPAVVEARYARVPLLLLTADRPAELRESGANQTIDQVKLFGDHVRWFVDVAPPEGDPPAVVLRYLRTLADRAMAVMAGVPPGPVHLNFPFRKPLEPTPVPADRTEPTTDDAVQAPDGEALAWFGREPGRPFTRISRGTLVPEPEQIEALAEAMKAASRGLIVCGPRCATGQFPQAVARLARASGFPILADALSGVRFGPHLADAEGLILGGYETFLSDLTSLGTEPPTIILRFGAMPTSKALEDFLAAHSQARQIAISGEPVWQDAAHSLSDLLWADPILTCQMLAERLEASRTPLADPGWAAWWRGAERRAWAAIDAAAAESFWEGQVLAEVVDLLPAGGRLFVGNSLPVRHLDQFARPSPRPLQVFANRGASGIDGVTSTALGVASTPGGPLVLVTGDLSFYHDLNGLLALRRCGVKATIVVINNNGGGIFHRLPIARFDPPFTDLFLTPHGLDFEPLVRGYGVGFQRTTTRDEFRQALQAALAAPESWVIEVPGDAARHEAIRRRIVERVRRDR